MSKASLCLVLCKLGRLDEARPLFEPLVDEFDPRAIPVPTGCLLAEAAVILSDTERARDLASQALTTAEELGLDPIADPARALLEAQ